MTVTVVAGLAAAASATNDDAGIQAVRQHTEQYHDEAAALADGFIRTDECVPGMGYHYVNPQRLDDRLELRRPEVLLYGPAPGGGRRLLGAEWVVVDEDGDANTDHDPAGVRPRLPGPDGRTRAGHARSLRPARVRVGQQSERRVLADQPDSHVSGTMSEREAKRGVS